MYKKLFKISIISLSIFLYGINVGHASIWDLWANEDEELNSTGSSVSKTKTTKKRKSTNSNSTKKTSSKDDSLFSFFTNDKEEENEVIYENPNPVSSFDIDALNNQKPIVICRQKGCTELNDKMTRNYLFNSIANLLYVNNKTKVYLCDADTNTRACKSNGLKYAVNIGGTAGVIYIPSLTITDVSFSKNLKRINFMFSYDLYANGLKSFCTSAYNTIEISENKQALIRDNNYKCQLTSDLPSTSYNIYNIDYVDLDYGIIGAYYSTGMSGASHGGHEGYVLMKFQYTDKNTVKPASNCKTGICDDESYKIAPGQYEIIPLEKNKE